MDINLHYIEKGTGFPLVLLHGNGESAEYFDRQIDTFARYYRVIAVDTRGHGQSPRGAGHFKLTRFAEDLKLFLDGLGIREAHLLGFSDGGNIALLFALRYPAFVARLVLNGANLSPFGLKPFVLLPITLSWCLASLLSPVSKKSVIKRDFLALMLSEPNICPTALRQLQIPVLVIVGSRDMIRQSHTATIYRHLPHGVLTILDGSHFIAKENSAMFNDAVLTFLSD
ncbi:alpha/beta hydrolase [Oscillospiraceae bacterium WX1]